MRGSRRLHKDVIKGNPANMFTMWSEIVTGITVRSISVRLESDEVIKAIGSCQVAAPVTRRILLVVNPFKVKSHADPARFQWSLVNNHTINYFSALRSQARAGKAYGASGSFTVFYLANSRVHKVSLTDTTLSTLHINYPDLWTKKIREAIGIETPDFRVLSIRLVKLR